MTNQSEQTREQAYNPGASSGGEAHYEDRRQARRGNGGSSGFTGLFNAMIGFTNAATMFTIQQMQNAMLSWIDSRRALDNFQHSLNNVSDAMNQSLDDTLRTTGNEMNRAARRVVDAMGGAGGGQGSQASDEVLTERKR